MLFADPATEQLNKALTAQWNAFPGVVKVGPHGYIHGWIYVGTGPDAHLHGKTVTGTTPDGRKITGTYDNKKKTVTSIMGREYPVSTVEPHAQDDWRKAISAYDQMVREGKITFDPGPFDAHYPSEAGVAHTIGEFARSHLHYAEGGSPGARLPYGQMSDAARLTQVSRV